MTTPDKGISELFTPFLPSTYNTPSPDDPKALQEFLGSTLSDFSDVVNDKKIGQYLEGTSVQNGEDWWYKNTKINRNGFQAMAFVQSLPGPATTPVANQLILTLNSDPRFPIENINTEFVITSTWGDASRTPTSPGNGDYFSFMNRGDPRITYDVSDNSLTITTTVDLSAYSAFFVIEFLRRGT